MTSKEHTITLVGVKGMATPQPTAYSRFKFYGRNIDTDAASNKILLKLAVGIPATPPDDGEGLGRCAEVGDVIIVGVDSAAEDDGATTVLDGMLVVALPALVRLPAAVAVAAPATKELRIDE